MALWLLPLLAGCGQPACSLAPVAVLHLSNEPTGLYAPVAIDGRAIKLLLDTGSTRSLLTSETARQLRLPIERLLDDTDVLIGFAIEGLGGRRHVDRAWPHKIELGHAPLLGVALSVVWSRGTAWDASADGILGMDVLSRYDLDLDVGRSRLALYEPGGLCSPPFEAHALTVPLLEDVTRSGPRVTARIGGQRFDALIDTGTQQSSIMAHAAAHLDLRNQRFGKPFPVFGVGTGRASATMREFDSVSVGGIVLRHTPLAVVSAPGLSSLEIVLGTDFLAHFHLWLSSTARTLSLAAERMD